MRQYGKTMLLMLIFFGVISAGLDNPAIFFESFIILMSTMLAITSFSYDTAAKWDRYALSLPITRKEVVASKYLLSIFLCLIGTAFSFPISALLLRIRPVEGMGFREHLYATGALLCAAALFISILLPLTFRFGVEKGRIFLFAICAAPGAMLVALSKLGVPTPSESTLLGLAKLLPAAVILLYLFSYFLSVRIYAKKEI
jgi:ABC-type transport system involved in multi-copper enzyme maturation permease subunit